MNGRLGSVTSTSRRIGELGASMPNARASSPERPPAAFTTTSPANVRPLSVTTPAARPSPVASAVTVPVSKRTPRSRANRR